MEAEISFVSRVSSVRVPTSLPLDSRRLPVCQNRLNESKRDRNKSVVLAGSFGYTVHPDVASFGKVIRTTGVANSHPTLRKP